MSSEIPDDHPRALSLRYRHKIIEGMRNLVVAEAGLIAHGRGEAFDYLIGEKTNVNAVNTMKVAVISLLTAEHPVISVNGNVAALCPNQLVQLSNLLGAPLEINLFYGKPGRIEAIHDVLIEAGAKVILGADENYRETISDLSSNRRFVDARGIKIADVVLVPLEDGDRTEALIKEGKKVITIDLNPLSRTAQKANVTIVDNVIRAMEKMIEIAADIKKQIVNSEISKEDLKKKIKSFDNRKNLSEALKIIVFYLQELANNDSNIKI